MTSALDFLGLHPEDIERASLKAEELCKVNGMDIGEIDDVWDEIKSDLETELHLDINSLEHTIIYIVYRNFAKALRKKGIVTEYFVNGCESTIWETSEVPYDEADLSDEEQPEQEDAVWLGDRPGHTTGYQRYICSSCRKSAGKRKPAYCPNCGKRMSGKVIPLTEK